MTGTAPCECGRLRSKGASGCIHCRRVEVELRRLDVAAATVEGRSAEEIALALGITERSVVRMRARLRELGKLKEA